MLIEDLKEYFRKMYQKQRESQNTLCCQEIRKSPFKKLVLSTPFLVHFSKIYSFRTQVSIKFCYFTSILTYFEKKNNLCSAKGHLYF
jgi:hypothetical protein